MSFCPRREELITEHFSGTLAREFVQMVLGEHIGRGAYRDVYDYQPDPTLVVKVERAGRCFANVMEWETWYRAQHVHAIKDFFAPCINISACGSFMLQRKTEPVPHHLLPKWVPKFMTDLKQSNFGMLEGRVVTHDYALHLLLEQGMDLRLVRPNWWNE